jgi:hypothetical protein
MTPEPLAAWYQIIQDRDVKGLDALLSDHVVFHSPSVYTPQRGKQVATQYLAAALRAFFNESFRYVREVTSGRDAILEFQVEIDGDSVNGVDMLTWDETGKIVDFKVMIRPLKGIKLVHQKIAAMLERHSQ